MKTLTFIAAVLLTVGFTACGSDTKNTAETTGDTTAAMTPVVSTTAEDVAMPTMEGGVQVVHVRVDDMGYTPSRIAFKPGVPARIIFDQQGTSECSSKVKSLDLGIAVTNMPQGKETAINFTPDKEGEYTFTCGMDMLKGTVIVKQS